MGRRRKPPQFTALVERTSLSDAALAQIIGAPERTVREWKSGAVPASQRLAAWMSALANRLAPLTDAGAAAEMNRIEQQRVEVIQAARPPRIYAANQRAS